VFNDGQSLVVLIDVDRLFVLIDGNRVVILNDWQVSEGWRCGWLDVDWLVNEGDGHA
jgi:hypothetical protein